MTKVKKDEAMHVTTTQLPPLPVTNEKKRLVQAEVNQDLFDAVSKEMDRKKYKIRQILEWGLKAFLLRSNPKEASRLGIVLEEKE